MRVPSQLLRQHVQVRDRTEDMGDGPSYGPSRRIRCRIDWKTQLVRTSSGEDITVVGEGVIRPETQLAAGAEMTVDGDARTVADVVPIYGPGAKLAGRKFLIQ